MNWFKNLRVSLKVLICCTVFIGLLIAGSIFAINSIKTTDRDIDIFYGDFVKPIIWGEDMYKNVLQSRVNMFAVIEAYAKNDNTEIDKRIQDYRTRKEVNDKLWKQYMATSLDAEEKKTAAKFVSEYEPLISEFEKFITAIKQKNLKEAEAVNGEWLVYYRKAARTMDEIITTNVKQSEEMIAENKANSNRTIMFLYVLLGFSIFSGVIITLVLARSVSGPVAKGLAFAKLIADGDFTERIDLEQKDELGQLGKALNTAADDLEKMVADIVVGSQNLVQAIQEISAGNENLSQRTSEQASSLEEVAATVEETSAAINQNAENAKQANDIATNAVTLAENGGRVVGEAVSAINEVNDASKRIEAIISVINEIAFQTNLLALNAAVEAARAGEQGRGFAVVAGEVRNLAQRSGSAAKEIGELIKTTVIKVDKGTALANKSGDALKEIVGSVKNVGRLVSEIHAASEEQKQGASQINTAIAELDSATQQNAGLVEETASASEEIANQAQDLLSTMERFKIRKDTSKNSYDGRHKELHLKQTIKKTDATKIAALHPSHNADKTPHVDPVIAGGNGNGKGLDKILGKEGFEQF